jgi:hypothetical protein
MLVSNHSTGTHSAGLRHLGNRKVREGAVHCNADHLHVCFFTMRPPCVDTTWHIMLLKQLAKRKKASMYLNAVTVLQPAVCAAVQKLDALYARLLMSTRYQVKPHRASGQIQLYVYVLTGLYK